MKPQPKMRYAGAFAVLLALLAVLFVWNVNSGSLHLSVREVAQILLTHSGDNAVIVWEIRLPRIFAAILLGGALSVSGFLLQTFFANPIAGPFVLGISSGAKLTVALTMIGALSCGRVLGSAVMITAAFAGAMLSMGFVLLIAQRVRQMPLLVVSGVMIGYICSAVTDFVITFAEDSNIVNLHNWSMGSFSGISWDNIRIMTPVVLAALVCVFLLSKPIGAYQLGEGYARSMGVNITAFRVVLILLSSVLLQDSLRLFIHRVTEGGHDNSLVRNVEVDVACGKALTRRARRLALAQVKSFAFLCGDRDRLRQRQFVHLDAAAGHRHWPFRAAAALRRGASAA